VKCKFRFEFRKEGTYTVAVTATLADGTKEKGSLKVNVQDWLIIGLGDSLASGEGVPPFSSPRCDRSVRSWQSLVALAVEHNIPKANETSVTFVHLACSGAELVFGLLSPYAGIAPPSKRSPDLPPQLDRFKELIGNREVDAVLLSAGVNEFRFGALAEHCAEFGSIVNSIWCKDFKFYAGQTAEEFVTERLGKLDGLYKAVGDDLSGTRPNPIPGKRVYITEYPDFLHNGRDFCRVLGGIQPEEAKWLYSDVFVHLNEAVDRTATANSWNVITGVPAAFADHGYCASDAERWIVTFTESRAAQGNSYGSLHPNKKGHLVIATLAYRTLYRDLYPGGIARSP
jgi:hypothetical protein